MAEPKDALIACEYCDITIGLLGPDWGMQANGLIGVSSECPVCGVAMKDMKDVYRFISWSPQAARKADVIYFELRRLDYAY